MNARELIEFLSQHPTAEVYVQTDSQGIIDLVSAEFLTPTQADEKDLVEPSPRGPILVLTPFQI